MCTSSDGDEGQSAEERPLLSGVVVHWGDPAPLFELAEAWPKDPSFELVVVDNGDSPLPPNELAGFRLLRPQRNLGFAGGVNYGSAAARAEILLLLNPDAAPEPGALQAILQGFAEHPEIAGLAPRLIGPTGKGQWRWQLRPLPSAGTLWLQALLLPAGGGPAEEPPSGTPVEQPAAAVLALRSAALAAVGGFDPGFFPAWFEDVDLARRFRESSLAFLYHPEARFRHRLGGSVPSLGFGPFIWIYYRNLTRYLAKHHGRFAGGGARGLLVLAAFLRLLLLPLRRPRRARNRREAAAGLVRVGLGSLTGWRRPKLYASRFSPDTAAV